MLATGEQREVVFNEFDTSDTPEHPSARVYQDFYRTYAPDYLPAAPEPMKQEVSGVVAEYPELLAASVLHVDNEDGGDRSTHLIVRRSGNKSPEWTHTNNPGAYADAGSPDFSHRRKISHYNPDEFVVSTTDGRETVEWKVDGVYGYNAPFAKSGISVEEQVVIDLIKVVDSGREDERARLVLNKGLDSGYMQGRRIGWVLGRESSDLERLVAGAIPPTQEIIDQECSDAVDKMLAERALRASVELSYSR